MALPSRRTKSGPRAAIIFVASSTTDDQIVAVTAKRTFDYRAVVDLKRPAADRRNARRYGLFTLVGIAGEDDLDAPDLLSSAAPAKSTAPSNNGNVGPINLGFDSQLNHMNSQSMARRAKVALRLPVLGPTESGAARDKLLEELVEISAERLTVWARTTLPIKNRLQPIDADAISNAFTLRIKNTDPAESQPSQ